MDRLPQPDRPSGIMRQLQVLEDGSDQGNRPRSRGCRDHGEPRELWGYLLVCHSGRTVGKLGFDPARGVALLQALQESAKIPSVSELVLQRLNRAPRSVLHPASTAAGELS